MTSYDDVGDVKVYVRYICAISPGETTMPKSNDDKVPGSTLGGAADQYVAEFVDGRYIAVPAPGPLRIASWPAPDIDPAKVAAFKNEPGPPSIVEKIISDRNKLSEHEISQRRLAVKDAAAINRLSGYENLARTQISQSCGFAVR